MSHLPQGWVTYQSTQGARKETTAEDGSMRSTLISAISMAVFLLATLIVAVGLAMVAILILPWLWAQQIWQERRKTVDEQVKE